MSLHELTDEQREIRDLARRFADEEIAPHAGTWDREHRFPKPVFEHLGELGLMGVCVPEEHGGAGADFLSYVLVLEELSRAASPTTRSRRTQRAGIASTASPARSSSTSASWG